MFRSQDILALLSILALTNLSLSYSTVENQKEPDCILHTLVCNDLDFAKRCDSYDWCKNQSMACGAIEHLEKGSKSLFGQMINDMHVYCDKQFIPFKRLYGVSDSLKIKLDVQTGQLPFTLNFNFDGNTESTSPNGRVKIDMNNKEIYNNLYNDIEEME